MAPRASAGARGRDIRSDCWVEVGLPESGRPIVAVQSKVEALYGADIRRLVASTLAALDAADLSVTIEDTGALPYTLMARIEAAVLRLRPATTRTALPALTAPAEPTTPDRLRRSRLYLPGNAPKLFINAGLHRPDAVILDLEDSVAPSEKDAARILVRNALRAVDFYGAERMVRINPLPLGLDDVRALAPQPVQTLLIPKVERAEDVAAVDRLATGIRRDLSLPPLALIPILESARGVLQAWPIATAAPNVVALAIGLEDYTRDLGAQRTAESRESWWALGQVVNAARAAGVQPLASVYSDVADTAGLQAHTTAMRGLGFDGIGCIHPRQIAPVHAAFAPSPSEVDAARRIVAAFDQALAEGLGVIALDGQMIDRPVVDRARYTLHLARAASSWDTQ